MKETKFIKDHQSKWLNYEKELANKDYDPKTLGRQFLEATDDLSFAQTHYKNRSIRLYLNGLAQQAFLAFKVPKRAGWKGFVGFWQVELPKALYMSRKQIYWAFALFMFFMLVGMLLTHYFPNFPETVLGTDYVNMTQENIKNNDPMAVYKKEAAGEMFFRIASNNLMVSFKTFVQGLFFGLGTIFALLANGVMVGAFQYMFVNEGVLQESLLGIWMHGAIEIPSIVIAAGAGFTLIKGFFYPGAYSRYQAFILSAKQGVRIYMGLVPFIILAAFIESYVTRMTELNDVFRGFLILGMFIGFLYYFIIYPVLAFKRGKLEIDEVSYEEPGKKWNWEITKPLNQTGIFAKANELFILQLKRIILVAVGISLILNLIYSVGLGLGVDWEMFSERNDNWFLVFISIFQFLFFSFQFLEFAEEPVLFFLVLMAYFGVVLNALKGVIPVVFKREIGAKPWHMKIHGWMGVFVMCLIATLLLALPHLWGWIIFAFLGPYVIFPGVVAAIEGKYYFSSISKSNQLIKGNYGTFIALNFMLAFLLFIYAMVINGPIIVYSLQIIRYFTDNFDALLPVIELGIRFLALTIVLSLLPLYFYALVVFYKNSLEINYAPYLSKELKKIAKKVRAFGIERE